MEWQVIDEVTGKLRRKYSNETMRKLKVYMDEREFKTKELPYNIILDEIDILIANKRLRTEEEIIGDRNSWEQ